MVAWEVDKWSHSHPFGVTERVFSKDRLLTEPNENKQPSNTLNTFLGIGKEKNGNLRTRFLYLQNSSAPAKKFVLDRP